MGEVVQKSTQWMHHSTTLHALLAYRRHFGYGANKTTQPELNLGEAFITELATTAQREK
jgi:hypothetical protein